MNLSTEAELRACAVGIVVAVALRNNDFPFDDRDSLADMIETCAADVAGDVAGLALRLVDAVHETADYPALYDDVEEREKDRDEDDYRNKPGRAR